MIQQIKQRLLPLFRGVEKYLKTDLRYLVRGGFWLTIGQGVAMFAGFFLSLTFAHLFSKESFGIYKFILSVAGILGVFSLTEMGTAITRAVAQGFDGSLQKGFRTNLKWSIGILVGGLSLGGYYFYNGNSVLSISFILAGIFLPLTLSAGLHNAYLLGKKDFRKITSYGIVRNIAPAAFLILTLFLTQNILIVMCVYFLSSAGVSLFLYYLTRRAYRHENTRNDPGLTTYGKHLSAMEVIGQFASQIDKILIFHYLGAAPLAIYAFAIAPVEQLQAGKKILSSLILPKISERPFEELQKSAPRKSLLLALYAFGLAGAYVLFAPYFYKFFFPQYLDSILYSQIYSLTLIAVAGTIFDSALVAHKKTKELYIHRTIVPIVKIALFIILLPFFGLMGLIITHITTRTFSAILGYYFVTHPFKK